MSTQTELWGSNTAWSCTVHLSGVVVVLPMVIIWHSTINQNLNHRYTCQDHRYSPAPAMKYKSRKLNWQTSTNLTLKSVFLLTSSGLTPCCSDVQVSFLVITVGCGYRCGWPHPSATPGSLNQGGRKHGSAAWCQVRLKTEFCCFMLLLRKQ